MDDLIALDNLKKENKFLQLQLEEANQTLHAIRTGQIDALVVEGDTGHVLYTLKTADQNYRVFLEKMLEGAVAINTAGIIVYSNQKFATMVNLPLSKVLGLTFDEFVCVKDKEKYRDLFTMSWINDCKGEIILETPGEKLSFCQASFSTLELDEGISLSIILTDIGSQKETEKNLKSNIDKLADINHDLEVSNDDLQQFAYSASHDLQEPLRKIHIFSQRIKASYKDALPAEVNGYLDKIIASTLRMENLISDILSYSRLSEHNSDFQVMDLNIIVSDILKDLDLLIEDKKAVILVDELPSIEVNPGQIRQVFQNLIGNALKFSKIGVPPFITITCTCDHPGDEEIQKMEVDCCYICISDNGIGFPDEYSKNIFALFQRLHSKDKYEGTGIGLAIAKKVTEKHNVAHSHEGEGAKFTIILPLSQR
jgi:signal transduction histidine kinase